MYITKLLTQAFRMIKAYRLYSIVNIVGLALGLACTIIISKYIFREMTVDHFHRDYERICALTTQSDEDTHPLLCEWFLSTDEVDLNNLPEIQMKTNTKIMDRNEILVDDRKFEANLWSVDSNFFKVFDYPLIVGDTATVLDGVNQVILTQEMAHKIFGEEDPLGRRVTLFGQSATVAGVLGVPAGKSTLLFDALISYSLTHEVPRMGVDFYKFYPGVNLDSLNKRYDRFYTGANVVSMQYKFQFMWLKDIYLSSLKPYGTMQQSGNLGSLRVLGVVALVVLLIGIFNFINIYTVILLRRSREIGVKKVFGVSTPTILRQFICENLLMVALAVILALFMVVTTAQVVERYFAIEIVPNPSFDLLLIGGLLVGIPMITILYPYLKYRYASPITSLKEVKSRNGSLVSRKLFLVAQYTMTVVLLIVSIYFIRQLHFMLHSDLGYNSKNLILTSLTPPMTAFADGKDPIIQVREQQARIAQEGLSTNPLIVSWSCNPPPIYWSTLPNYSKFKAKSTKDEYVRVQIVDMDPSFQDLYAIDLVEGRLLNLQLDNPWGSDPSSLGVIMNEKAKKLFGIQQLGDCIECETSQVVHYNQETRQVEQGPKIYQVVGIVRDFNFAHLAEEVPPVVFLYSGNYLSGYSFNDWITIRYPEGKEQEIIKALQKINDASNPGSELKYKFFQDEVRALYAEDQRVTSIYSTFALIAIFISSLGLFSLSIYDVQQRYREIALRKVHGSTVGEVLALLSRRYYRLLLIACVIAIPIAWYIITVYTRNFAVRAPLSWWIFAVAVFITAAISLLTLWWQTYRAAIENPAKAMKSE